MDVDSQEKKAKLDENDVEKQKTGEKEAKKQENQKEQSSECGINSLRGLNKYIAKKFVTFRTPFWIVLGLLLCALLTMLVLALPLTEIVIGSLNVKKCPIDSRIPVFLIVSGAFPLIVVFLSIVCCCVPDENIVRRTLQALASLFMLIWLILGSVWVMSVRTTVTFDHALESTSSTYCNQTCYLFSFWLIIALWSAIALFLFGIVAFFSFVRCCR